VSIVWNRGVMEWMSVSTQTNKDKRNREAQIPRPNNLAGQSGI